MYPRKTKEFVEQYANDVDFPVEDLWMMVYHEFHTLRQVMYSWKTCSVSIERIGRWWFRSWKIDKDVQKTARFIKNARTVQGALYAQELMQNLIHMDHLINVEVIRRRDIRERKTKGHYPDSYSYINGCRCLGCRAAKARAQAAFRSKAKGWLLLEEHRLKIINYMKIKEALQLAWENRSKIAEGFYNTYISHKEEIQVEKKRRKEICESNICGYYDAEGKPENAVIPGKPSCSICKCNIDLKTATMSDYCALKKMDKIPLWEELMTEEMDNAINKVEYEQQFKK